FLRVVGGQAAALVAAGSVAPRLLAAESKTKIPEKPAKPAEALVRELYASLTEDQKKDVMLPWDHRKNGDKGPLTRMGMYNGPIAKPIGKVYTKPQQELLDRILRAVSSDEDGYQRITRNGTFDGSRSLEGCGANIFGEPTDGKKFAWLFTGH